MSAFAGGAVGISIPLLLVPYSAGLLKINLTAIAAGSQTARSTRTSSPPKPPMAYGKLIIAAFPVGPIGFAMGAGAAWLLGASSPSFFGVGVGALFVLLAMLQSVNGKSIPESEGKKVELVAFTVDPTAIDLGFEGSEGPYVVMRKRKGS